MSITVDPLHGYSPQRNYGIKPEKDYEVWPPWFWWDSDAPEPRFAETLTPVGNSQTSQSTPSTGVERG